MNKHVYTVSFLCARTELSFRKLLYHTTSKNLFTIDYAIAVFEELDPT